MCSEVSKPVVLLESGFLVGVSFKNPEFLQLLEFAKQKKIELYVSRITFDEWRTNKGRKLIDLIEKISRHIDELNGEWSSSAITQGLPDPIDSRFLPAIDMLEQRSVDAMRKFCDDNSIGIIQLTEAHMQDSWDRYFSGSPPYRSIKSRTDIPDCWIFVAALELKKLHGALYCLIGRDEKNKGDQQLGKALRDEDCLVYSDIKELIQVINPPEESVAPHATLDQALTTLAARDRQLRTSILGYVAFFQPILKHQLVAFLEGRGFTASEVDSFAQQLVVSGTLTDTGNNYIASSGNEDVLEQARAAVMNEIIEIISQG